jgi:hypothetical protein
MLLSHPYVNVTPSSCFICCIAMQLFSSSRAKNQQCHSTFDYEVQQSTWIARLWQMPSPFFFILMQRLLCMDNLDVFFLCT